MNKTGKILKNRACEIITAKSRTIANSLAQIVFPTDIYCICCGSIIDSSRTYSLCDSCIEKFQWIGTDTCQKCGKPLGKDDPHDMCRDCRTLTRYFDKGYTCCLYDLYARAVVMDLKYRDKSYLGRIVGDILADRMEAEFYEALTDREEALSGMPKKEEGGEALSSKPKKKNTVVSTKEMKKYDLVIPVPVSRKRMESRGYNQAALIAARFAERTGIPMDEKVLVREDRKKAMKDLDVMQRRLNVRGAFSLTEHGKMLLQGSGIRTGTVHINDKNDLKKIQILVIDDIYTTGSTVDECARILKDGGASRVDVLTFAAGANRIPGQGTGVKRR